MLTTLNLKVGSILHDMEQNIDHRVIYMNKDYLVTILINDSKGKIELNEWHLETVQYFIAKKEIAIRESKHDKVFDFDALSEKSKETYLRNKISNMVYESKMMTKVIDLVREIYVEFDSDSIGRATRMVLEEDVNHRLKPHEVAKEVIAILNEEPVKPKRKATRRTPASKNICNVITDDN